MEGPTNSSSSGVAMVADFFLHEGGGGEVANSNCLRDEETSYHCLDSNVVC